MRPLSIPTMTDRAMLTLYKFALEPLTETLADLNSYGFRIGRSTHDAIGQCFNDLCRSASPQWILEGGIKGCFDHISHNWLLEKSPFRIAASPLFSAQHECADIHNSDDLIQRYP